MVRVLARDLLCGPGDPLAEGKTGQVPELDGDSRAVRAAVVAFLAADVPEGHFEQPPDKGGPVRPRRQGDPVGVGPHVGAEPHGVDVLHVGAAVGKGAAVLGAPGCVRLGCCHTAIVLQGRGGCKIFPGPWRY